MVLSFAKGLGQLIAGLAIALIALVVIIGASVLFGYILWSGLGGLIPIVFFSLLTLCNYQGLAESKNSGDFEGSLTGVVFFGILTLVIGGHFIYGWFNPSPDWNPPSYFLSYFQ
ncbi:hypothetical protein HYW46_03590 [Candidatus Daviesbacteria bacterium]|nr:hypothetical protein [Candidatus Daviesbacteria bacterium]